MGLFKDFKNKFYWTPSDANRFIKCNAMLNCHINVKISLQFVKTISVEKELSFCNYLLITVEVQTTKETVIQ
jgi:hypothetical protein